MLDSCEIFGCLHQAREAFVIQFVCSRSSGASAESGANRYTVIFFRDILMDCVVGETRQRTLSAEDQQALDAVNGPGNALSDFHNSNEWMKSRIRD